MYDHYVVIRDGQEIARVHGVDHYTQNIDAAQIAFYDADRNVLKTIAAEVGDIVRPVVIGFYDPFPEIDQSPERIRELSERMERLRLSTRPFWNPL